MRITKNKENSYITLKKYKRYKDTNFKWSFLDFLKSIFSCEEAALEVTFKLVNQSKSVMSCNGRHSDQLLVNQSKSVMSCNVRHSDQLCLCVRVSPS